MDIFQAVPHGIIKTSFRLSVRFIELFYNMAPYKQRADMLAAMPQGTLGNDIAKCLTDNNLRLVPKFESHDLKHVLLDYKMTPVDEIRMQAFMLGNGNYSPACFIILLFGMLLLPAKWLLFYHDFVRGRQTQPISSWQISAYAGFQTDALRKQIANYALRRQPFFTLPKIVKYGAFSIVATGIAGMLFCLPFLFSSSLADLIGAGFPFIGGAILVVGGLLVLSNLTKQQAARVAV